MRLVWDVMRKNAQARIASRPELLRQVRDQFRRAWPAMRVVPRDRAIDLRLQHRVERADLQGVLTQGGGELEAARAEKYLRPEVSLTLSARLLPAPHFFIV